ncbi:alpha/beta hydrolase [Niveispirillum sp.]|uniref:alpha/beta hydrolase n=1 Tax=Niveispirillum sp. TaxID=1917217 RepID=UPI001B5C6CB4|nr:alpha/beta hydrolase [Niveispirillum sp.]MBP7334360.1 alpha/beta hydrolase [Niveispirillum sp.]
MSIDPEIQAARLLQASQAPPGFDITRMDPAVARAGMNRLAMVFTDPGAVADRVETLTVPGPGGPLRVRLYHPAPGPAAGAILFVHGGGWFACDVDTHDPVMRRLALASGRAVIGFDYRLAPEHPFPAALDDTRAVWDWVLGLGMGVPALAGDSAGANLALALMLSQRDAGSTLPTTAALAYGCYAPGLDTGSQRRFGDGSYGLSTVRMHWYWRQYLGALADAPPVLAAPLGADMQGLPPCFIGIAECDVLADENRMMAERMRAAGVRVQTVTWPGATHGFLQMTAHAPLARAAVLDVARALTV